MVREAPWFGLKYCDLGPGTGIKNNMLFSLRALASFDGCQVPERSGAAGRRARKRARAYLVHARAELHKRAWTSGGRSHTLREKSMMSFPEVRAAPPNYGSSFSPAGRILVGKGPRIISGGGENAS